ncbi:MAG: 2Fe-2S iron-sulfur cluster-binding protein, partial [Candidatus Hydrogenedentota bacterium]
MVLAGQIEGKNILTVEGFENDKMGQLLQEKFADKGAIQCGFCTPGMLMSAYD